jgi:plastocyanin
MGRFRGLAAVAVLAFVAVACSNNPTTPSSGGTTPAGATTPLQNKGTLDASATTDKVEIELDNEGTSEFYFKPSFVKVKAGQIVTLDLKNEGDIQHNFTITSLNVDKNIDGGKETDVNVTFPASGGSDIQFFCAFHVNQGMRGAFFFGSAPVASGGSSTGRTTY